jgi:hypothetical protein
VFVIAYPFLGTPEGSRDYLRTAGTFVRRQWIQGDAGVQAVFSCQHLIPPVAHLLQIQTNGFFLNVIEDTQYETKAQWLPMSLWTFSQRKPGLNRR